MLHRYTLQLNSTTDMRKRMQLKSIKFQKSIICILAGRLAVDPMKRSRVIDILSMSIKPHIVIGDVTVWDKPLKHVVDVLICDDRQCGVQASTKLSRIIPIHHWTVRVETILLIVHWVALAEGRYHIYDVQQNQHTSCRTFAHRAYW